MVLRIAIQPYIPIAGMRSFGMTDTIRGKYNSSFQIVPLDEEFTLPKNRFHGTLALYDNNVTDASPELLLPDAEHLQVADFVHTNVPTRFFVYRNLDVEKYLLRALAPIFDKRQKGFSIILLVIGCILTTLVLKWLSVNLNGVQNKIKDMDATENYLPNDSEKPSFGIRIVSQALLKLSALLLIIFALCTFYGNIWREYEDIEDIENFLEENPDIKVRYLGEHSLAEYAKRTNLENYGVLWKRISQEIDLSTRESFREMAFMSRQVITSKDVSVIESTFKGSVFRDFVVNDAIWHGPHLVVRTELPFIYALSVRKSLDPVIKEYIKRRIHRAVEADILHGFYELQYTHDSSFSDPSHFPEQRIHTKPLAATYDDRNLRMTLLVWIIGLGASFLCFLTELVLSLCSRVSPVCRKRVNLC